MVRNLVILGSTGSIGRQTLEVVRQCHEQVQVVGLAAFSASELLGRQAEAFRAKYVAVSSGDQLEVPNCKVMRHEGALVDLVTLPEIDLVVVATSGRAGLMPTLAALQAGKLVALANKEALVMAGPLIRQELERGLGQLVPIDSEHSAIWQCLQGEPHGAIEQLVLTASGGALRALPVDQLAHVTPEQVLQHPTWSMGRKITVDSANLVNKGLEALEAQWLFNLPLTSIAIVLHLQSIVHSLVMFIDGSVKAQLGLPDMRLPIQYALSHPERWHNDLPRLNIASLRLLNFGEVDPARYPAMFLALRSGELGGTYPACFCAADEVVVEAFLSRQISFQRIPEILEEVLDAHNVCSSPNLADILGADDWARLAARRLIRE